MKRLMLLGVFVALCSFAFFNWLQKPKPQEWEGIVLTPAQEEWLQQRFILEERVNRLTKEVTLLEEKYQRIFNERKSTPHWSAADARIIVQEIESSKKYAQSKKCKEPDENLKDFCNAYEQAQADREWWARLTLVSVQLSAAQHLLAEARVAAGEFGENTEAIKRELLKRTGSA